ncbi:MAG: S8 family serine peptidase [Pseudomonadota bacterium]|nr:S8 family serine peptidase [Pseudomonadota bacterium]
MQMPLRYVLAMTLAAGPANAQLRLPSLPLPTLPLQTLPQTATNLEAQSLDRLSSLRRLAADKLIRANRQIIETDPAGDPIVRNEILVLSPIAPLKDQLRSLGFIVDREQNIDALNIHLVVLRAPPGMATKKALRTLREADPSGIFDYNHIYSGSGMPGSQESSAPQATSVLPSDSERPNNPTVRIGLLDTGLDISHPAFQNRLIRTWGCGNKVIAANHGTAVASLLVGRAPGFAGVRPDAMLYAADVYCGAPTGGSVDTLVAAFGWMVQEKVPVINVSLVGPKNLMLERVIAALIADGYVIVAAVGNDGPAAPPLYPASYPHVVGVTAVDAHHQVLIEAARGAQVMFAAYGADMAACALDHTYQSVRGTSFAAPIVAAMLAGKLSGPDAAAAVAAIAALAKSAIDLGPPGKDLTYGLGLVGAEYRVDPTALIKR